MSSLPTVSVIIPVYNAALYLQQCLKSIVVQTLEDFECTCIDNGGMDSPRKSFRTGARPINAYMLGKYPEYRMICLNKLTYAGNLSTLKSVMDNPKYRFVKLAICDREGVYKLFVKENPDMVVNFAAESHVDRSIDDPSVFLQTNIIGTGVLMDACRKYGITRYHQVSTDEVYGDLPLDRPDLFFTEETPLHTSSPFENFVW